MSALELRLLFPLFTDLVAIGLKNKWPYALL